MLIALVQNNLVVGVYQPTDEIEHAYVARVFQAAIDVTDMYPVPQIGWHFDGLNLTQQDGSAAIDWRITKLAFRSRFTLAELVGIQNAGTTNPVVAVLQQNLSVSTYIELSRPDTIAGVQYLVSQNLLTSQRANAILTTVPTDSERPLTLTGG